MMDSLFRRLFSAESRAARLAGRFDADATRMRALEEKIRGRSQTRQVFGTAYGSVYGSQNSEPRPTLTIFSPCGGFPLEGVTIDFAFDYFLPNGSVNPSPTVIATKTTGASGTIEYPYDPSWVGYEYDGDVVTVITYRLWYSAYHPTYGTWYPSGYSGTLTNVFGTINGPYNATGTLGIPAGGVCVDPCFAPYPWASMVLDTPWGTFSMPPSGGTPGVFNGAVPGPSYPVGDNPIYDNGGGISYHRYSIAYPASSSTVPTGTSGAARFTINFIPGDFRGATCTLWMAAAGEGIVGGPSGYATLPVSRSPYLTDGTMAGIPSVIGHDARDYADDPKAIATAVVRANLASYSCDPLSLSFDFADGPEISVLSLGGADMGTFKLVYGGSAIPYNATASDIEASLNASARAGTSYTCTGGTGGDPFTITYNGTLFYPNAKSQLQDQNALDFTGLHQRYPPPSFVVTHQPTYVGSLFPDGNTIVTLGYP